MSSEVDTGWLDELESHGAAKNFVEFCKTELARRNDTIENFDAETHEEAIKMVLRKLGSLDTGDLI